MLFSGTWDRDSKFQLCRFYSMKCPRMLYKGVVLYYFQSFALLENVVMTSALKCPDLPFSSDDIFYSHHPGVSYRKVLFLLTRTMEQKLIKVKRKDSNFSHASRENWKMVISHEIINFTAMGYHSYHKERANYPKNVAPQTVAWPGYVPLVYYS